MKHDSPKRQPRTASKRAATPAPRAPAAPNSRSFVVLEDPWQIEGVEHYDSPSTAKCPQQTLLFPEVVRNGRVEATVKLGKSLGQMWNGKPTYEATLVVRYQGADRFYYAGVGAFGSKYFIAKAVRGNIWQRLGEVGSIENLKPGDSFRLALECSGYQITLFENGVRVLEAYDEEYAAGQWGIRTWKTSARFTRPTVKAALPVCFVVMPFAQELSFVHNVIQDCVRACGMECIRADERFISEPVMEDVKKQIAGADLVIVDFSGRNPNVYYEAGLADAWKKKWIVLAQSPDDLTFDVKHIRTILYSNRMGADVELRDHLDRALRKTMGLSLEETRTRGTKPRKG